METWISFSYAYRLCISTMATFCYNGDVHMAVEVGFKMEQITDDSELCAKPFTKVIGDMKRIYFMINYV